MIYYRGLKFPHRAEVVLVLERDGACTYLNDNSARKCALLVLVCCNKARGKENRFCEGTDHLKAALSNGMTSLQVVVASARSVIWGEQ